MKTGYGGKRQKAWWEAWSTANHRSRIRILWI